MLIVLLTSFISTELDNTGCWLAFYIRFLSKYTVGSMTIPIFSRRASFPRYQLRRFSLVICNRMKRTLFTSMCCSSCTMTHNFSRFVELTAMRQSNIVLLTTFSVLNTSYESEKYNCKNPVSLEFYQ